MNYRSFKKGLVSLALIGTFILGAGLASTSLVQAQDWRRMQERREIQRQREWERQRRQAERERQRREREYRRGNDGYGNYGNYGRYDENYNKDLQKGYRDGLDRGQKDAKTNRVPTPNNSSHYREGKAAYREGFRRGYEEGYRQYAGYRRW
jgi:hypothetical protein